MISFFRVLAMKYKIVFISELMNKSRTQKPIQGIQPRSVKRRYRLLLRWDFQGPFRIIQLHYKCLSVC